MALEVNPLNNWQERFPLPQSFSNIEFRFFALGLEKGGQIELTNQLVTWSLRATPDQSQLEKLDTFIGGLARLKASPSTAFPLIPAQQRGQMLRLTLAADIGRIQ